MEAGLGTAAAVLALGKTAWKLSISLTKLNPNTENTDTIYKSLIEEVKLLGHECGLAYVDLEEVTSCIEASVQPRRDDVRIWECLTSQVEEACQMIQDLDSLIRSRTREDQASGNEDRRQNTMVESKCKLPSTSIRIRRVTENLHLTVLLIKISTLRATLHRNDCGTPHELAKLQDMLHDLQGKMSEASAQPHVARIECILFQHGRDILLRGTIIDEDPTTDSTTDGKELAVSDSRVTQWVNNSDPTAYQERLPHPSSEVLHPHTPFPPNDAFTRPPDAISGVVPARVDRNITAAEQDLEDDLDADLVRAAVETGTKAFIARDWQEADCLLQEALQVLYQLPTEKQSLHDLFDLQYKLAVCAYYTGDTTSAEKALTSLIQQPVDSDEQRACIYDATHFLSLLYVRMGQLHRARSECEKTLVARRRLLGKHSDASLDSTALMSHIHVLLNNQARAKMCIAMIPEKKRPVIIKNIEDALGTTVNSLNSPSLSAISRPMSADLPTEMQRTQSILSTSSPASSMGNRCYGPVSTHISPSLIKDTYAKFNPDTSSTIGDCDDTRSVTMTSISSVERGTRSTIAARTIAREHYSTAPQVLEVRGAGPGEPSSPSASVLSRGKTLSRKDILDRIGCQPRDDLEEAVCNSDHQAFTALLHKEKGFFRSKLRRRARPERVTALHFAALFGEIDMAKRLISSNFNINEIPFGYSTSLTPLKFAIGARRVEVVEFLVAYGAKPSEPDTWSTLAGQLMNRSWLRKTMSESEKEFVPKQIIAIMKMLLKKGWDINAPIEKAGATVLHQAVTFWTDSYRWDLNLRTIVTSFLCEQGADVYRPNLVGQTPCDMAIASGYQDLIPILSRSAKSGGSMLAGAVELST